MANSDELTVWELFSELAAFYRYALKKWWLIMLSFILIVGGSLLYRHYAPRTFTASLTYLVEGSGGGGGSAILNQLGLGSTQGPNIGRIEEVAKSDQVGLAVLNKVVEIDGEEDRLGNFIIELGGLREAWRENKPALAGLSLRDSFPPDSARHYASLNKILLNLLYRSGGPEGSLLSIETNEFTLIATINAATEDEELSLLLANTEFNELREFYINKLQARQLDNISITQSLTDSLKRELDLVQARISQLEDRARNVILNRDNLTMRRLRQDEQRLILTYGEVYKNLQIAEFTLRSQRPNIEVIDRPFAPIYPYRYPLVKLVLLSGIVSVIAAGAVLFLFYLRRKYLSEKEA
jgi:hypothetical protein